MPVKATFVVRRMGASDVPSLVDIHQASWAPYELSVKLGPEYLRLFYSNVIESPDAFGYVSELPDAIVGYAVGFSDYNRFNSTFARGSRWSLGRILTLAVLRGRISPSDLVNLLSDDRKGRNARFMRWHLGSLALANAYKRTPEGREAITSAMAAVISHLRQLGAPGCSAVCDGRNVAMRKSFVRMGFRECEEIRMAGRSVILLEQAFGSDGVS